MVHVRGGLVWAQGRVDPPEHHRLASLSELGGDLVGPRHAGRLGRQGDQVRVGVPGDGLHVLVDDLDVHVVRRASRHGQQTQIEQRAFEAQQLAHEVHLVQLPLGAVAVLAGGDKCDVHVRRPRGRVPLGHGVPITREYGVVGLNPG